MNGLLVFRVGQTVVTINLPATTVSYCRITTSLFLTFTKRKKDNVFYPNFSIITLSSFLYNVAEILLSQRLNNSYILFYRSFIRMSKLNIFALFGVMFLSSALLVSGTYISNQTSILAQENEAEIKADIEQENKCAKDTECENENKINNQLSITNTTQDQEGQPVTSSCETCFTDILTEEQITSFIDAFGQATEQGPFTSIEDLCNFIDAEDEEFSDLLTEDLFDAAFGVNGVTNTNPLSDEQYQALIQCLQDVGLNVDIQPPV